MHSFLRRHADIGVLLAILGTLGGFLAFLQNPVSLDDGLRHLAMARLMLEKGIFSVNGWSEFFHGGYLSTLKTDPWFLSNAILIPLAPLSTVTAMKLYVLFSVAAVGLSSLLVLRAVRAPVHVRALLLVILLTGDPQFFGRMLLGRPFTLMTAMTLLAIWAVIRRQYLALIVILCISVLLSQLFVFPLAVALIGLLWRFLSEPREKSVSLFFAVVAGIVAGILLHPQPAEYLQYLTDAFLRIPFMSGAVRLSNEMQPGIKDISAISVSIVTGVCVLLAAWGIVTGTVKRTLRNDAAYLTLCAGMFLALFLPWVRAIDLLWPVLVCLLGSLIVQQYKGMRTVAKIFLESSFLPGAAAAVVGLQALAVPSYFLMRDDEKSLAPYQALESIPQGSRVFNSDWNKFFIYVSLRPDLSYTTGVDPVFTYLENPEVHRILTSFRGAFSDGISDDRLRAGVTELLALHDSEYLVLSREHYGTLIGRLSRLQDFALESSSDAVAVFRRTH